MARDGRRFFWDLILGTLLFLLATAWLAEYWWCKTGQLLAC